MTGSRRLREGSVGLLVLVGLGLLGGLLLWIRGVRWGAQGYTLQVSFPHASGLQVGGAVRLRGVEIGRVTRLDAGPNAIVATLVIDSAETLIPRKAVIKANQSGLVSETVIDINPEATLNLETLTAGPRDEACDPQQIVCQGEELAGRSGASFDDLVAAATQLSQKLDDSGLIDSLNTLAKDFSRVADQTLVVAKDAQGLLQRLDGQLDDLTQAATSVTLAANRVGATATKVGSTADEATTLLRSNRAKLTTTLDQLTAAITDIRTITADLKSIAQQANTPENRLVLQQTLDAARATFANTQKLTTDMNDLVGDPRTREDLRRLIRGLSRLITTVDAVDANTKAPRSTPTGTGRP
ncbi:MAG: MCE family protein [Gloeomargaritaceae cyanobacterium C42_A2020_066]|nr:MCE family protein [Gloeomargaritaceae cyanobacterium C42_A2020_066]